MDNGNSNSNDKIYSNSPLHTTVIESTPLTIPHGTVTFLWNWKPYGGSMVRPILANASGWRPHSRSLHWPCRQQWSALLRARSLPLCPAHVAVTLLPLCHRCAIFNSTPPHPPMFTSGWPSFSTYAMHIYSSFLRSCCWAHCPVTANNKLYDRKGSFLLQS